MELAEILAMASHGVGLSEMSRGRQVSWFHHNRTSATHQVVGDVLSTEMMPLTVRGCGAEG